MSELSDRLLRVALLGVVPADDQHVIADAQLEIERLEKIGNDMLAALKAIVHPDVEGIVYFVPSDAWAMKLKDDALAAIAKAETTAHAN